MDRLLLLLLLATALIPARELMEGPEPAKPTAHAPRDCEGWTVQVDQRLLAGEDAVIGQQALKILGMRLADIRLVVAPDRLAKLQRVPIRLDRTHGRLPTMQYHPNPDWLTGHGYDVALAKGVHIPDARRFIDPHHQQRQPWCVFHELAHAYHDQVLGFDQAAVRAAWQQAVDSHRYDQVLLINGRTARHYALTDHKEFFAEMSEAYFGVNDFFPFNRAELHQENPACYRMMAEIWGPAPDAPAP